MRCALFTPGSRRPVVWRVRVCLCVSELLSGCPSVESACCVFPRSGWWFWFRLLSFGYPFQVFFVCVRFSSLAQWYGVPLLKIEALQKPTSATGDQNQPTGKFC